jgi:hypothetical protein
MTGAEIMAVVGFFIMLSGAGWRVWSRVEGKVKIAEDKAEKIAERADANAKELAAHKLHVAENYVTKSGMKEIKDEILGAVSGIKDDLRHLTIRIDATHDAKRQNGQ